MIGLAAMMIAPNEYNPITNRPVHQERVTRIERLLTGKCHPTGLLDTKIEGCKLN
jgi:hypothetical protein